MTDDLKKRQPEDTSVIRLDEPEEVRWWCAELGCTVAELENAVRLLGPDAALVRRYLVR